MIGTAQIDRHAAVIAGELLSCRRQGEPELREAVHRQRRGAYAGLPTWACRRMPGAVSKYCDSRFGTSSIAVAM